MNVPISHPEPTSPRRSMLSRLAMFFIAGLIAFGTPAIIASPSQASSMSVRRFAVIIGSNDGGGSRVKLRYAGTDAKGFAGVLKTLGGLSARDTVLIEEANIAQIRVAFKTIAARIAASTSARGQARTEVVVYYSGHSDEKGLLPGGALLPYTELKRLVKELAADVRIVVLDSCASGALIRTKGGKKRPGFMVDASSNVKGQAIITSASADEQAQESDRIGASFFTHHLVSGLRGAADSDGDGKVTLSEAYKHAFHETLRRTQGTASGPQHPNYDINLAGTGDVVLTSLRSHRSKLVLRRGVRGRLFVRDSANRLVVELAKERARTTELGLSPGSYTLLLRRKARVETVQVILRDGAKTTVTAKDFAPQLAAVHRTRGNRAAAPEASIRYIRVTPVKVNRGRKITTAPTVRPPIGPSGPLEPPAAATPSPDAATASPDASPQANAPSPTPPAPVPGPPGPTPQPDRDQGRSDNPPADPRPAVARAAAATEPDSATGTAARATLAEEPEGPRGDTVGASFQVVPGLGSGWQTDRTVRSFSFNLIAGRNGAVGGFEMGMVNLVNFDVDGFQMGLWNHVGRHVRGFQLSGLVNYAGGDVDAFQLGGFGNLSRGKVSGLQLGSLFNVAGRLEGGQLGLVNVAGKAKGLMLGLVNIADSVDGAAIGVLNIIDDGYQRAEVWTSDTHAVALGYKLGGRALYTSLFVGLDPYHELRMSFGFGIGFHAVLADRLSLDADVSGAIGFQVNEVEARGLEPVALLKLRVTLAYRLGERLGIFGGLTVNTALAWDYGRYEMSLFGDIGTVGKQPFDPTFQEPGISASVWPGFVLGLQL